MKKTVWASLCHHLIISACLACLADAASAGDFDDSEITHIGYPDWFRESPFTDLKEDLQAALSEDKQGLMVLFTTEGCSYCGAFIDKSLGDPVIASTVRKNFESIGLEIFDDTELTTPRGEVMPVKNFADAEGAGFSPTLLFYGEGGNRVLRAVGYQSPERFKAMLEYIAGGHFQAEPFNAYFERAAARREADPRFSLRQDPLFSKPPYALDRSRMAASQPLLVLFEQEGCRECAEFHEEVLALEEVRALLSHFEIVRLEASDGATPVLAPDGSRTTAAAWFDQTGFSRFPAMLFFDEMGAEVLRTDALVRRQRMLNSMLYVIERAYEKDWTYQRFARSKAIERSQAMSVEADSN